VNKPTYLSREGEAALRAELDELVNNRRSEVAARIHDAKEHGDLSENAEYEEAKNEQAFVEGRILELERTLASAQEIRKGRSKDQVRIGSTVVIQEDGSAQETYTIVGVAEANPKDGLISNESPLGRALLDKKAGDEIRVDAPAGVLTFRIIKIK
jgi:transcription elongation factor GreA